MAAAPDRGPLARREALALRFTLPLPPGVNNQYLTVGRRRVLSGPAKAFTRDVAKVVARARATGAVAPAAEAEMREAFLGVDLTFYFATPRRRDLDGGLKIA